MLIDFSMQFAATTNEHWSQRNVNVFSIKILIKYYGKTFNRAYDQQR